jgi:hypothetical protein
VVDPNMTFDGQIIKDLWAVDPGIDMFNKEIEEQNIYIEYLNQGGSFESIKAALNDMYDERYWNGYMFEDITGDHVEELILRRYMHVIAFGCKDQSYTQIVDLFAEFSDFSPSIKIIDLNNNGLSEIIMNYTGCWGNKCFGMNIFEFDGIQFNDLLDWDCTGDLTIPDSYSFEDMDGNGTTEIILEYISFPAPIYHERYPVREETMICMWNGAAYLPAINTFGDPIFRFQAVQDGDRQMIYENYDQAISFYQQAIHDQSLDWYTQQRLNMEYEIYANEKYGMNDPDPTATPALFEDPNEYPILASYSYYRLALIYLLQGNLESAQNVFVEQQTSFSEDQAGSEFIEMTELLIQNYQETRDISRACDVIRDFVSTNRDRLESYEGYFNYTSEYYLHPACPY